MMDAQLLRIYLDETDKWEREALYEAIILKAREAGLAGATVLRGTMGYGASSVLHTAKILRLSTDLPVVIEIVDAAGKIQDFLPRVEMMMADQGGLIILEKVEALFFPRKK
jgi:hypothetical protein